MKNTLQVFPALPGLRLLTNALWTTGKHGFPTLESEHLWVKFPQKLRTVGIHIEVEADCNIDTIVIETSEDGDQWELLQNVEVYKEQIFDINWPEKEIDNIRISTPDPQIPIFPVSGNNFSKIDLFYIDCPINTDIFTCPDDEVSFQEIENKKISLFEKFSGNSGQQIFEKLGLCHGSPETNRVSIKRIEDDVCYTTPNLSMRFSTQFALIKGMAWNTFGNDPGQDNLLSVNNTQGAFPVVSVDGRRVSSEHSGCSLNITGRTVAYRGIQLTPQLSYDLIFTIQEHGFTLKIKTTCQSTFKTNEIAALRFPFDLYQSAVSVLGMPDTTGPCGLVRLPLVLNAPNFGTVRVTAESNRKGNVYARVSPFRTQAELWMDIIVGAQPLKNGLFEISEGTAEAELKFELTKIFPFANQDKSSLFSWWELPPFYSFADRENIMGALPNAWLNGFSFRPELGRFANNCVADSATVSAAFYADIAAYTPDLAPGLHSYELLRFAAEQILTESKQTRYSDAYHYPGSAISTIDCAWLYIATSGNWGWAEKMKPFILENLNSVFAREYRDTGLIASPFSGIPQENTYMSASWMDSLRSGHLESTLNAYTYRCYHRAADILKRLGDSKTAAVLLGKAKKLKENYLKVFYDEKKGRLAQWVDSEGTKYGFDTHINLGMAVSFGLLPQNTAVRLLREYLDRLERSGIDNLQYGLPIVLESIPAICHNNWSGKGVEVDGSDQIGMYMNGALTHSQCYFILQALYQTGLRKEANSLFQRLAPLARKGGLCGPLHSGLDWRTNDGAPAGYEGLLAEQFHFLLAAITGYLGMELTIDGIKRNGPSTERAQYTVPDFGRMAEK